MAGACDCSGWQRASHHIDEQRDPRRLAVPLHLALRATDARQHRIARHGSVPDILRHCGGHRDGRAAAAHPQGRTCAGRAREGWRMVAPEGQALAGDAAGPALHPAAGRRLAGNRRWSAHPEGRQVPSGLAETVPGRGRVHSGLEEGALSATAATRPPWGSRRTAGRWC